MTSLVSLLGPVVVHHAGRSTLVGPRLQQTLLCTLALRRSQSVSTAELIEHLWQGSPPKSAKGNLRAYAARLRALLEPARAPGTPSRALITTADGYLLDAPHGSLDVDHFEDLARRASELVAAGRAELATSVFQKALEWWRGEPMAGVATELVAAQRALFEERRLDVLRGWGSALLALDRPDPTLGTFLNAVQAQPVDDELTALTIRLLRIRERRQATPPRTQATAGTTDTAPRTPPSQLPHGVRSFVGRQEMLNSLRRTVDTPGRPRLAVLHGAAGTGKTALAVHFGRQVSTSFPDGQLYVDLKAFSAHSEPMRPELALGILLRGLGHGQTGLPTHLGELQALYRTSVADRKLLVVLDNAANAAQIRPLIPGTDGSFVIVTSRRKLTDLAVFDGATSLHVGTLDESSALDLITKTIGSTRQDLDATSARALVNACGLLPLALCIAADRIAARPHQHFADLVTEIHNRNERLDLLSLDEDVAVRTAIGWSCEDLPSTAVRLLKLLGGVPLTEISVPIAAALLGSDYEQSRQAILALLDRHLLDQQSATRYWMHDLVALYATELWNQDLTPAIRRAAQRRLLDWYLHGAAASDRVLSSSRHDLPAVEPADAAVLLPEINDMESALEWCETELHNTVDAVKLAASAGFRQHAWQIPTFLMSFYFRRSHLTQWVETMTVAVEQTRLLHDEGANYRCQLNLIGAFLQAKDFHRAADHCDRIMRSSFVRDHPEMFFNVLNKRGLALMGLRNPREAIESYNSARLGIEALDNLTPHLFNLRCNVLSNLGQAYTKLDMWETALRFYEHALTLREQKGDLERQSLSLSGIGALHLRAGRLDEAVVYLRRASHLARQNRTPLYDAEALRLLGRCYAALQRPHDAQEAFREALTIFETLYHHDAGEVRYEMLEHLAGERERSG